MTEQPEFVCMIYLGAVDHERLARLAAKAGQPLPELAMSLLLIGLDLAEVENDADQDHPLGPGGMDDDIPF